MDFRKQHVVESLLPEDAELCVTVPSGKAHTSSGDDGRTGWKRHIVFRSDKALCGLQPRHGWGVDLFDDGMDICKRCRVAAGVCKACIGDQWVRVHGPDGVDRYDKCESCKGTGIHARLEQP